MEEINFNSDSDHPGSHALEDKTRSGTTTIPIDAKCKSRFGIFAIFVERRQPRGRQNVEKREREKERGRRRPISQNNRCTHIVATLPRYCFTLQNIAFYLRAASSHGVENSPLVHGMAPLIHLAWIRTDDYATESSLPSFLSPFRNFLSFFQVESGGERILNVRFRFSSSKVSWKVKVAAGVTG